MNKRLLLIILFSVLTKAFLTFFVTKSMRLTWDEESAWSIAENHQAGHGYSRYYENTQEYRKSAFHGSFTVILYDFLIHYHISKYDWIVFSHIISFFLFGISVYYFYLLTAAFLFNERTRLLAAATYAFYPSVIYYVGSLMVYENFATYLLIIFIYRMVYALKNTFSKEDHIFLPLIIAGSCLFRPQLILIYPLVLLFYFFLSGNKKTVLLISLIALFVTLSGFIPTLQKNHKLFGHYTIGTQRGFELLQGHNPVARGSWMHHWEDAGNPLYEYAHNRIRGLDSMDEYQASEARKKLAISWAIHNPAKEVILDLRKTVIYFLPDNFEELDKIWLLDILTLFVHILFFAGLCYTLLYHPGTKEQCVLYFPVIASLMLTLIFYVGYRWRLYAEPFMIMLAWIFVENVVRSQRTTVNG